MVRGLKSFINCEVPKAQEIIKIEQKIEEWKCKNHGVTPVIVIDFPGFYRLMCNNKQSQFDVLFGNHENSLNLTEAVLSRFKDMGVQLEFFYGGSSKFEKNRELITKRQQQLLYYTNNTLLDMIKPENSPEAILQRVNCPIYNNGSYFVAAIMLAEKYGNLHKSYYNECKRDIAMYATRHNAVAVMAADYEFLLVKNNCRRSNGTGHWNFWDLVGFNPTTFQILQINKNVFRNTLGLSDNELLIFGVLTKNEFKSILVDQILNKTASNIYLFKNIAKFIKEKFCELERVVIPLEIARALDPENINQIAPIAEETLKFFENVDDVKPMHENKISIVAKNIHNSYVYEYLNDLYVPVQTLYWRQTAYPAFMECALIIHRRQMGVVLKHTGKTQIRSVMCINSKGIKIRKVEPIYPLTQVPSLFSLYNKTKDNDLLETKLKLLCWIISGHLNYKPIEKIPKPYLCAILTLVYMVENLFISSAEADFILYCIQDYQTNPQSMNSLSHPDSISEYPFQLIFLYSKFHQFIAMSMNTVGLSNLVVHNQLNGIYFHKHYEEFIHFPSEIWNDLLGLLNDYRLYLNT